jgi:hypothetical protein
MALESTKRLTLIVGFVVLFVAFGWWFFGRSSPPQLGGDDEVFDTVDALFTAVRSRDDRLLDGCQERLHGYARDGKLPAEAARYLDDVLATARAGKRRPAAEKLYEFMKVQRRAS